MTKDDKKFYEILRDFYDRKKIVGLPRLPRLSNYICKSSFWILVVQTFITEDGQTGQIYISSGGVYMNEGDTVTLGESNITTLTSPDGQVISLDEETIEQLAGL